MKGPAEKLQIKKGMEMGRAHRTGKPGGDRPRSIVVKFRAYMDRSTILQNNKNLNGTKIDINEDYRDAVRKKRN